MLKIVLLGYSRGLISSRRMEQACQDNIVFMAISGDSRPSYTHIAKFVRSLGPDIHTLFTQVLMTCDRLGLIGRTMFAIDGVKLPSNASKERSGTHAERRIERIAWTRQQPRWWRCTKRRTSTARSTSTPSDRCGSMS
jgi:transposase